MSRGTTGIARLVQSVMLAPIRLFMTLTGHRPDQSMTPVQPSEFAERSRAQDYLNQLARDQEAHYVVQSAEAYLQQMDDQIAGRPPRLASPARH
jgi:hypothetical protein